MQLLRQTTKGNSNETSSGSMIGDGDWKSNLLSALGLQRPETVQALVVSASGMRSEPTTQARMAVLVKDSGLSTEMARHSCSQRANYLIDLLRKAPRVTKVQSLPMRISLKTAACILVIDSPIGEAISHCNTALRHGACKILHIATLAVENKINAAKKAASSHAIRIASQRAQYIAKSKGMCASLCTVIKVNNQINFPTKAPNEIYAQKYKSSSGAIDLNLLEPIQVGQHVVKATVQVEFTLH